jgi:hypothetical protein
VFSPHLRFTLLRFTFQSIWQKLRYRRSSMAPAATAARMAQSGSWWWVQSVK